MNSFFRVIYRLILRRFIHFHPLLKRDLQEVSLWDYNQDEGWMEGMDYVLRLADTQANEYEKLEKELIAAEYAACRELALLGGTILDNGCGVGRHMCQIIRNRGPAFKKVIGVDISSNLLTNAVKHVGVFLRFANFHRSSVDRFSFLPTASVDSAIIMYRTFGNLPHKVQLGNIRETFRVLRRGGIYVLSLGNKRYMKTIIAHYSKITGAPKMCDFESGRVVYGDGIRQRYMTEQEVRDRFLSPRFKIKRIYSAGHGILVWLQKN